MVYEDQYQQLYRITADFGDFTKEYTVRDSGRRVGVVAVRDGSVLLVRQYRLLIDGLSWEIPGGKLESGESPETAAARECFEEAGIRCENLRPLVNFHLGLDTLLNPTFLFYCEEVEEIPDRKFDPAEVVDQEWVPLEKSIEMVFENKVADSFSMVALLAYSHLKSR